MLWGLVKVAAQDAAGLSWSHSTALPQGQQQYDTSAAVPPAVPSTVPHSAGDDSFGSCMAAGALLLPRLLPASAAGGPWGEGGPSGGPSPPSLQLQPSYQLGATLITGGGGALGTLIASQQLQQAAAALRHSGAGGFAPPNINSIARSNRNNNSSARMGVGKQRAVPSGGGGGSTHLILLGRRPQLAALEGSLGASWRHVSSRSGTAATSAAAVPLLTVWQCDSTAAADVAALAHGLRAGGVCVSSVMHAAGVLKVGTGWFGGLVGGWFGWFGGCWFSLVGAGDRFGGCWLGGFGGCCGAASVQVPCLEFLSCCPLRACQVTSHPHC
jgi:hypothetical protein